MANEVKSLQKQMNVIMQDKNEVESKEFAYMNQVSCKEFLLKDILVIKC